MSSLSQPIKIVNFLKQHPDTRFTAREIAKALLALYPDDYSAKRNNARFSSEEDFVRQLVAEVGSCKHALLKLDTAVKLQDQPRPRRYWYSTEPLIDPDNDTQNTTPPDVSALALGCIHAPAGAGALSEHDLYPLLIEFLKIELNLYCLRIDEKRSSNKRGPQGNHWLHPDIVAIQPLDLQWSELVRTCAKHAAGQNVKLWSFEVKKQLNGSNLRSSFFQAVSNSSWAHEGYLVATELVNVEMDELSMLSALHGIGFILLNIKNPEKSTVLLPARSKAEADWQTINRIVQENKDFSHFIDLVATYYQAGRIHAENWNK